MQQIPSFLKNVLFLASTKAMVWVGLGLIGFSLIFGPVTLIPNSPLAFGLRSSAQIILGVMFCVISFFETSKNRQFALASAALLLSFFYFLSDLMLRTYGFYAESAPFVPFVGVFVISFFFTYFVKKSLYRLLWIISILVGVLAITFTTNGNLIFTDDHPSFLYRLSQLKDHFPNIPFYNLEWNAGVEAREFFASGILNVYFLFAPLIYISNLVESYNLIIVLLLFFLLPMSLALAGKLLRMSWAEVGIAIALALSCSLHLYRWSLVYGTLGFITSLILAPLILSMIIKFIEAEEKVSFWFATSFVLLLSLMSLWSLAVLPFIPLGMLSLYFLKRTANIKPFLLCIVFTLIINLPWIYVFFNVSNVGAFFHGETTHSGAGFDESKYKKESHKIANKSSGQKVLYSLRKNMLPVNPLVLSFGLLGSLCFLKGNKRLSYSIFLLSTALLAFVISGFKPQLELERMALVFSLVLCLPAGKLIYFLLTLKERKLVVCSMTSFLVFIPFWIWKVCSNQSTERYTVATPLVENLAEKIKINNQEARTLFSGFSLHELDGGHLAPLPLWTESPLIASSFQHDKWKYVDVIPQYYRDREEEGVMEYLELMNVSLVVSNDKFWKKWFLARPKLFTRVYSEKRFNLFKVNNFKSTYFLEGEGRVVSQAHGKLKVILGTENAVLKFNHKDFLKSSDCDLTKEEIRGNLTFIRLTNCPLNSEIIIEAKNVYERFIN